MLDNKVNLLVIDDDDINIFIIKKIVEKTGLNINMVSKGNGQLALDYIKGIMLNPSEFPQLMLIDINMPIMNGWEFLENYQRDFAAIYKDTKIVVLSSTIDPEDVKKTQKYSTVLTFVSKPITKSSLEEIERLLSIKLE